MSSLVLALLTSSQLSCELLALVVISVRFGFHLFIIGDP